MIPTKREVILINTLYFLTELYGDAEGWLTLWTKDDKKTYWLPLSDLNNIAEISLSVDKDIYYGVGIGSQKKMAGRLTVDDVAGIPALWCDIDIAGINHVQANLPVTTEDAIDFLNQLPLQPSIIINSGYGLHVYWLLKEVWMFDNPEERQQAQSVLKGFQDFIRSQAKIHGWKFDSTHDLARVLRLPGTKNYKSDPIEVTVMSSNQSRFNPSDFEEYAAESDLVSERHNNFKRHPSDGPASMVIDNCIFIQMCRDHAHKLPEPEWLAMISNIARCSDGVKMCHELSSPYSDYSYDETEDKINHALNMKGPQTCKYIQDSLGFAGCPGNCGVKAPCSWALEKAKKADPIPADFWETEIEEIKIDKFTDLGNGERFSRMYHGQVKYCKQMDKWLIWNEGRWETDLIDRIMIFAENCIRSMYDDINKISDETIKKQYFKHAMKSEELQKLKAMVSIAKGKMPVTVKEFDKDDWLINCKNGIIDLKTGELLPHDPNKNMTKMMNAVYDPQAKCPLFEKFINDIFKGNKNIIQFMQRFLGYCLTGDTREQQFVIAFGKLGRNGKGTLLNLISYILNDYANSIPSEILCVSKNDKPSNEIARLAGARFVLASESGKSKKLDEQLVKKMTGQDLLTARFLYREVFEFMPNFKIVMMANDKPVASSDDAALWARIQLVPFEMRYTGANQDKTLKDRLRADNEVAGILQWLIEGCLEWQRIGLNPPSEVLQATNEYRDENDKLKDWMEECCIVHENATSTIENLYQNFNSWSLKSGEKFVMKRKNFVSVLEQKGFMKYKGGQGYLKLKGIAIHTAHTEALINSNESF